MTIREAGKGVVTSGRGTYNIGFNDGDETQFDVQNLEELQECWSEFCKEEKETLWDIAKKFFTTVEAIMEVNQKETEQVQTGDMILILKEVS